MKSMARLLLFAIIGIPMVAFAIANRHSVQVGLDPLTSGPPAPDSPQLPLFLIVFAALILGALLGGIAAWFGQGKHRRAARLARAEVAQLRAAKADKDN